MIKITKKKFFPMNFLIFSWRKELEMKILDFFRKEEYEKELSQIEKDIEKLNKGYIFVDSTQ